MVIKCWLIWYFDEKLASSTTIHLQRREVETPPGQATGPSQDTHSHSHAHSEGSFRISS